jgi:hypothetical protein
MMTQHIVSQFGIIKYHLFNYFIAQRTRPVMVNDLVRVSRTVPYACTVQYLYGAGNYVVKYGRVPTILTKLRTSNCLAKTTTLAATTKATAPIAASYREVDRDR